MNEPHIKDMTREEMNAYLIRVLSMNEINHTRLAAGGTIQGPREKRWPIWASVLFTVAASVGLWALVLAPVFV